MASYPSSEPAAAFAPDIRFRTFAGISADEPREWEPATVLLQGIAAAEWHSVRMTLNGRPLPVRLELSGGKERIAASWDRAPSGCWLLEIRLRSEHWSRLLRIRPAKIDDASFAAMLDDLESGLPASIALSLNRLGALAGLAWRPPRMVTLAQEIEHVRRALEGDGERPGIIRILHEAARDSHAVLADDRPWVPAERARRPSPADLPAAFRRAGNISADRRPLKVVDSRVEYDFNTFENRLLRTFRDQVHQRLRRLRRWIAASPSIDPEIPEHLDMLAAAFAGACHAASFLNGVGRLTSPPTRVTMVLLRKPVYRAGLEGFLAFRRSAGVQVSHPALDAPVESVPLLYEAWGVLTLITALLDAAGQEGMHVTTQRLHSPLESGLVKLLPDGEPALVLQAADGRTVTLTPQQTFPRRGDSGFRSVSYDQIPDITIEVRKQGKRSLFIFDLKYKLSGDAGTAVGDGRPKKEDIDKMHAYRDAIRSPDGTRPVQLAAILYPGPDEWFGDGIAALAALPGGSRFRSAAMALLREIISVGGGRWGGRDSTMHDGSRAEDHAASAEIENAWAQPPTIDGRADDLVRPAGMKPAGETA
jgi:hypothetical protein